MILSRGSVLQGSYSILAFYKTARATPGLFLQFMEQTISRHIARQGSYLSKRIYLTLELKIVSLKKLEKTILGC